MPPNRDWKLGSIVALATFPILMMGRPELFADFDTARDMLQAAACANGNSELCSGTPATWAGGFAHGSLWIRFLAICYRLDISATAIHAVTLAFIAIGAGVTAHIAHQHVGRGAALIAGATFLPLSLWVTQTYIFWNPTLLPLPAALFVWALLEHARRGRTRTAALAAVFLALAIDLHLVCLVLAPLLLATTVASARRPLLALSASFAALGLALWLDSAGTWSHNLAVLHEKKLHWLLDVGPLVSTVIGLAARPYWLRLDSPLRAKLLLAVMASWTVVPWLAGQPAGRYFAPSLPALAIGAGWLYQRVAAGLPIARIAIPAALALSVDYKGAPRDDLQWSLGDISQLAPLAAKHAIGGTEVFYRLEGLPFATRASFAALTRPVAPDSREGSENLLVVRVERASLPSRVPDDWTVVDLTETQAAVVRAIQPWLSRNPLRACFRELAEGAAADCGEASLDTRPTAFDYPPFSQVWDLFSDDALRANTVGYRAEVWFDIDARGKGAAHWLEVVDTEGDWRIGTVEGVSFEGNLPDKRVVIEAGSGRGKVALFRDHRAGEKPNSFWPPMIIETLDEEAELRRLYRQSFEASFTSAPTTESASTQQRPSATPD